MRLIDADAIRVPNDEPYKGTLKRLIEQQPTAYEKHKVAKELCMCKSTGLECSKCSPCCEHKSEVKESEEG